METFTTYHTYTQTYVYVCICVHVTHACMCRCVYTWAHVCTYVCLYVTCKYMHRFIQCILSLGFLTFPQTYIGSILSAVNPYKLVQGVYGLDIMESYMKKQLGDLPPHIYAIANEVYDSMWRQREKQCVLIRSG